MKHADFVHLHNHSHFSLLDGANPIGKLVERAAEFGMPAIALTDHGSMFGAVEFYQAARRVGVKPLLGMEAYVTRGHRTERTRDSAYHLVLLARNERGFKNLMKLSSLAYLEGFYYKPRVDHELLAKHAEGLLALSACPKGEVATDLLNGNFEAAKNTAGMYREIFGADNYFLEIQDHGLDIEDRIRGEVKRLAEVTGIPLVATNDCHYLKHEHASAHDVLLCIQTGRTVDDTKRMKFGTDQLYFKSPDEMRATFPDDAQALLNTVAVAERCNVELDFGQPLLPEFPLPPGKESPEAYLRELTWLGLESRFPEITEAIRERTEYELDVICRMGFASYFLIVRDFIEYAHQKGIAVGPGRGSVAGSLVAYGLRITDIDPLEHALIFERFLNPERVTMPDIDIDFDDMRRGEVIEYVKDRYGESNVTQIITFGTMGAKGVFRDVGRALGMAYSDVDRIARMVPDGVNMKLERALDLVPDLKSLPTRGPEFAKLLETAQALEGLARHASTHAAGVLITPGPLLDYVPLYRQKDESITTQWDMKSVEKAGLLKMDFLGLRTLSVLQESVALVKQHHGREIDLRELPMDDERAYKVFQDADTVAIFQFESGGMRDYLSRLKPTRFDDLVAMNALYRPGPMENIPYFIDCKHGRQVVRYDHPDLEPILKGTYGVFVYQEQVMEASNKLAGFSMAQGDQLRRAMGKKKQEEMDANRQAFVEGCKERKIPPNKAQKIFATMEKFAGYGFNKSHSAAYALLAYQCAYLKGYYPAEFMAATLTSEMSDSARIVTLIEECRNMKLEILPPDVNCSEWKFTIEEGQIRFGLGAVRNVGQSAVEALISAREEGDAFNGLFDLANRIDAKSMNKRVLESLVAAGACDDLGADRGVLFAGAGRVLEQAAVLQRERASGQSTLFGEAEQGVAVVAPPLPDAPPWGARDRSSKEKEVLGFYFSEHPLEPMREELAKVSTHPIGQIADLPHGTEVRFAALVGDLRKLTTKTGRRMGILTLEDLSGRIDCTLFPDLFEAKAELLTPERLVVASGRVESRDDFEARVLLSGLTSYDEAQRRVRPSLHLEIRVEDLTVEWLEGVDEVLSASPGECEVYLYIVMPDHSRRASRSKRYRVARDSEALANLRRRFPSLRGWWGKGNGVTAWLDFEKPVAELEKKIEELRGQASAGGVEVTDELEELERKADALRREIYASLTAYQRVQLARHPRRPYSLDYIGYCFTDWTELHGDRHFADDPAMVGGLAMREGKPVMVIGQQKGRDTRENLQRRFGMPNPEGYRKALRLMHMAERFAIPIVTLVDTPGAYPGLGAEQRGQAEAIAYNLREMARLKTPIITIIIGEGGSGGALAIAIADVVLMMENSVYSVISPEGCASILWRDGKKGSTAAEALRLTATDLRGLGIVDGIIPEPVGGAHRDPQTAAEALGREVSRHLTELSGVPGTVLVERRLMKYRGMGVFQAS